MNLPVYKHMDIVANICDEMHEPFTVPLSHLVYCLRKHKFELGGI